MNNDIDKLIGPPHGNKTAAKEILNHMKMLQLTDIFRDLHPHTKQFTRFQRNPLTASRLDFFLISKSLASQIQQCVIAQSIKSDHNLVTRTISNEYLPHGPGYWKFNNELLQNEDYVLKTKNAIQDYLNNNPADVTNPHVRWDSLKCFIRGQTISFPLISKNGDPLNRNL